MVADGATGTRKDAAGEKIAMTAPVVTVDDAPSAAGAQSYTMQFIMPSKYTSVESLPRPTDERVQLVQLPQRVLAVRQFGGRATEEGVARQAAALREAMARDSVRATAAAAAAPPQLARYNDPFTPGCLRTNEVWYVVDQASLPEAAKQ